MSNLAHRRWTVEEFFAWQEVQDERYELVDGFPVKMMAGARTVHNDVTVNIIGILYNQLRGRPCRPFNGDSSVETASGQIRRPDAGVDCGNPLPESMTADMPRLVVEILSPTTREIDLILKLEEYKRVASLFYILYVHPGAPDAALWSRTASDDWELTRVNALDGVLKLPAIEIVLPMAEIYERVVFPDGLAS